MALRMTLALLLLPHPVVWTTVTGRVNLLAHGGFYSKRTGRSHPDHHVHGAEDRSARSVSRSTGGSVYKPAPRLMAAQHMAGGGVLMAAQHMAGTWYMAGWGVWPPTRPSTRRATRVNSSLSL